MAFASIINQHHLVFPNKAKLKKQLIQNEEEQTSTYPIICNEEYKTLVYFSLNDLIQKKKSSNNKGRKTADTKDFKVKWKTEICHYWELHGECKYGDNCAFAHGWNDIRNRKLSTNYKTKQCKQFFEQGYCPYGARCQFSHKSMEMHHVSYLEILFEFISSNKIDMKILKCPRLKAFEAFGSSNKKTTEENRLQLLKDFIEAKRINDKINIHPENNIIIRGRPFSI